MSTLITLPPEVLRSIVNNLSGDWLVNLWLTGSRPLHQLLSIRSGVTSVILNKPNGILSTARLPGMLGSLINLTSLTFKSDSFVKEDPNRLWDNISKLHQLRTLSITLQDADAWMYEVPPPPWTPDNPLQILRPLAATFPHLESLTLVAKERSFRLTDLPFLPRSLTRLALPNAHSFDEQSFEHLAAYPNLVDLHINLMSGCDLQKTKLPSSLTSFRCGGVKSYPKSFWGEAKLVSLTVSVKESHLPDLPTTLENLVLNGRFTPPVDLTHLPNLRHLESYLERPPAFLCSPGAPLRSIPTIVIRSLDQPFPALPPLLTDLTIITALPEPFSMLSIMKAIGDQLKRLETLSVKAPRSTTKDMADVFQFMPSTLKSLKWDQNWTHISHDDYFKMLPSGLTALEAPLLDSQLCLLPRHTLTNLSVNLYVDTEAPVSYCMPDGSSVFPSTISTLTLRLPSFKRDLDANSVDKLLNALPLPSITDFRLLQTGNAHWTLEMTKRLNPSLDCLILQIRSLESGSIAALPKVLDTLSLFSEDMENPPQPFLTGDELKHLPRSLRYLTLSGALFTFEDEHLADLPPRLNYLNLASCQTFTANAINFLPRHCDLFPYPDGMNILQDTYNKLIP